MKTYNIINSIGKIIDEEHACKSNDKAAIFGCKHRFVKEYIKLQSVKQSMLDKQKELSLQLAKLKTDEENADNISTIKQQLSSIINKLCSEHKYKESELLELVQSPDENNLLQAKNLLTLPKKQDLIKRFNGLLGLYRKNKFYQDDVNGNLAVLQDNIKQQQKELTRELGEIGKTIKEITKYETEENLSEEYDKATEYTRNTSSMYKELYFAGARLGIDYIIIPDGTWYHGPATEPGEIPENYSLDYTKLGYKKGKPCCNYNGGASTIFDGNDLILTCDYDLYRSISSKNEYPHQGWVPCYNAEQTAFFNDPSLERQFETMIIQHKGNDYLILPQGKYPDLSDYDNYRVQQEMKNSPKFMRYSGTYGKRKENP